MNVPSFQYRLRVVAVWSWGLMAFFLPFSTALTLLFSGFGVIFGLLGFDWTAFKKSISHPISILCVALVVWLALSMAWSVAPFDELVEGISKYRKLLYVPLVAMLLISSRVRPWFLMNFFVIGCLVVSIGSLLSSSGLLEHLIGPQLPDGGWGLGGTPTKYWFHIGPPHVPTFGRAYIAQGAFLVFSIAYLIGIFIQTQEELGRKKTFYFRAFGIILATLVMVQVTMNLGGRTGYMLLAIGFLLWVFKLSRWRQRRRLMWLLLCAIGIVVWTISPNKRVTERTQSLVTEVVQYQEFGALTSMGLRLRFWEAGIRVALDRPLHGWGVGSYASVFSETLVSPLH